MKNNYKCQKTFGNDKNTFIGLIICFGLEGDLMFIREISVNRVNVDL